MLFSVLLTNSSGHWPLVTLTITVSIVENGVNIGMHKQIGTDDTLIIIVVVGNYTFDHMLAECGFHCDDNWIMGINNGTISDFDFATYWKLK
uniref:Uncharacterized protein n=1 Tax=Romanomermis culicivorax TaxID=13658 RepID=A0A915ITI7_ROMCU